MNARLFCLTLLTTAALLGETGIGTLRLEGACTYSLNPGSAGHSAGAESGGFSVNTQAGCAWTAQTSDDWIHTTNQSTGSGSVAYTIDPNPSPAFRTGTITVADKEFTIQQSGNGCGATINPTGATHGPTAASGSFSISTASTCSWSAASDFTWIHTTSTGTGSGTVQYTLDPFPTPGTRAGRITVAGQNFDITQTGEPEKPTISPIPDQKLALSTPSAPIPFSLTGPLAETTNPTILPDSSDESVVPNDNILLGKVGSNWVLVISPFPGRTGITRITLTASDAKGDTATTRFTVTVGNPPPRFNPSSMRFDATGQFHFSASAMPGNPVVIQVSADLRNWTDLVSAPNPDGIVDCVDTAATAAVHRYYRIRSP